MLVNCTGSAVHWHLCSHWAVISNLRRAIWPRHTAHLNEIRFESWATTGTQLNSQLNFTCQRLCSGPFFISEVCTALPDITTNSDLPPLCLQPIIKQWRSGRLSSSLALLPSHVGMLLFGTWSLQPIWLATCPDVKEILRHRSHEAYQYEGHAQVFHVSCPIGKKWLWTQALLPVWRLYGCINLNAHWLRSGSWTHVAVQSKIHLFPWATAAVYFFPVSPNTAMHVWTSVFVFYACVSKRRIYILKSGFV